MRTIIPALLLACAAWAATAQGATRTVFAETFDQIDGEGGNDGQWTSYDRYALNSSSPDNQGWTFNSYVYGGSQCLVLGRSRNQGLATTPTIAGVRGTSTVTFRAGAMNYSTEATTLNLQVSDGTLSQSAVTMRRGAFTTFTVTVTGNASGAYTLSFTGDTQSGYRCFYLDDVQVTVGNGGDTPNPDEPLQAVTGIAALKVLPTGTRARLFLPDSANARVTCVSADGTEVYLRDGSGALQLQGVSPSRPMRYNQHVAGWITGTFNLSSEGLPQLVVTSETSTSCLVIADRVTESDVAPVAVTPESWASHVADWVTLSSQRAVATTGGTVRLGQLTLHNRFALTAADHYQTPYDSALVDLTGIAMGSSIAPAYSGGYRPLTYVIDQDSVFVSPPAAIAGTTVRLTRSLKAGEWAPLTLPFALTASQLGGMVMTGQSAQAANGLVTVQFVPASASTAGVPALVRPEADFAGVTVSNVTLSATPAQAAQFVAGDHVVRLVGTYSPATVASDAQVRLFTGTAALRRASQPSSRAVAGTSAWVTAPTDVCVRLALAGGDYVTDLQLGDATGDGQVNASDVTALVGEILGDAPSPFIGVNADIDGDGKFNSADVTGVVGIILSN